MTNTFRAKFFHFLDVLISFAMIRAVAAAFIFVWSGFMNAFIQQTFNGNYSMEMWLANLIPCTMVFIAFIINMLFIPSMTQAIFGGAAGMADSIATVRGSDGCSRINSCRRSVAYVAISISDILLRRATVRLATVCASCSAIVFVGLLGRRPDLRRQPSSTLSPKGVRPPCPATLFHIETRLTPKQSLLTDEIGNEVYASHYAERKLSRFVIGTETVLLLGAFGLIFSLAHRPIANRYIRIDEMGRAQAIQYTDLNYSPARGRSSHISHGLGELSLHHQPRHDRQEIPAQLLLPVPDLSHRN